MPKRPALVWVGLLASSLAFACDSETAPAAARCLEGSRAPCTCADGQTGTQLCEADGAFGSCICAAPTDAPAPQPAEPAATTQAPAPTSPTTVADGGVAAAPALPASLTPEPGTYEVTIQREGQCISLTGAVRTLPSTTKTQRWRISVVGPNTLTIQEGGDSRRATLTNGAYRFDRPSEHGRALMRLRFTAEGMSGTGSASAVTHRGKNRRTAEDCSETLSLTGQKV